MTQGASDAMVGERSDEHTFIVARAGLAVDHCESGACWQDPDDPICTCSCEGCVRATALAEQAECGISDPRKRCE